MRSGEYWQPNPVYNELQFSPFHMSASTMPLYLFALRRYRPSFIHGYPSAVYMLAQHMLSTGDTLSGPDVKAVLLGSEGLEEGQRDVIQRAFRCRVFTWYGHSERVVLGGECECDNAYHHFPDYGVLEIASDTLDHPAAEGDRGEIVGTGLINRAMPLIRYRTGDSAVALEPLCRCGRRFDRFGDVAGRWVQEFVIGRSGARISVAALNVHGEAFKRVARYQYFQNTPGVLEIRVVPTEGFGVADVQMIERAYIAKVGTEIVVKVLAVPSIPMTVRGKVQRLIQATPFATAAEAAVDRQDGATQRRQ
jgi:phenylacetate-CoA ligase